MTFGEYADKWLDKSKIRHNASTHNWYKFIVSRLKITFENVPLHEIQNIENIEISDKYYSVLQTILNSARKDGFSAPKLTPIHRSANAQKSLNTADLDRIIKAFENEDIKLRLIIIFAIELKIRRGEILGLRWGDFDFEKQICKISRTTFYIAKNPLTVRKYDCYQIANFSQISEIVTEYREVWETDSANYGWTEDFLFQNRNGELKRFESGIFQKISKIKIKNNLPEFTLESLRYAKPFVLAPRGSGMAAATREMYKNALSESGIEVINLTFR